MNDRLLKAIAKEPVDATPVWFMRQAGRYLPEYRKLRAEHDLFDLMRDAELAAEVTAMPIERFDLDAAVLYSDISIPLLPAGVDVEMVSGVGPTIDDPIQSVQDVRSLETVDFGEAVPYVFEEIEIVTDRLDVPVVGFAGAPFTLGTYLVEGRGRKSVPATRAMLASDPKTWEALMEHLADLIADYLIAQHRAGADVVQVFDSWVGILNAETYREHVMPASRHVFERLDEAGVPSIHFGTGNPYLYPLMAFAGGDALSVDWRQPIEAAWNTMDYDPAIQGNLDPALLCGPPEPAVEATDEILDQIDGRAGHIFNLGHGCFPQTEIETVEAVVEAVHQRGST